ncbi:MAG: DMT family transporter [Bacteroidetes bacterium]|nr:DMT family transporter [Bacteroidota bacterium]MBK9554520.1 DMT family transporter [Bacteroidota bacterium]MBP9879426.1 DMT family transporter [Chitinophagales bacterium]
MIYLLLSILTSTMIFVAFKLVAKNHVNILQAIVINYTICVIEGALVQKTFPPLAEILQSEWLLYAMGLGCLFISVFYLTALTVKYSGVAVASIASKLSLIIPVIAAYFLYNETFTWLKIAGILVAMIAVVLAAYKEDTEHHKHNFNYYFFPLLVVFGSGIIDAFTKWNQENTLQESEFNLFLICVFGTAACIGWLILIVKYIHRRETFTLKSIGHGMLLGIPNYGTMYFLIAVLNLPGWHSSTVFPVNNIAIVVASCLVAMVVFKEKLSRINLLGITLSVAAILMIMLS